MKKEKLPFLVLCIVIAALFWFIPVPEALEENAWHFLGLFIAVILAVILQVMPLGAVCFIAIAIVALTGITTTKSSIRDAQIKTLSAIVLKDNSQNYKNQMETSMNLAVFEALKAETLGKLPPPCTRKSS